MDLVIDAREHSLIEDLRNYQKESVNILTEHMELGDVMIRKDGVPLFLMERKSVDDLLASLKDGRYHDQRRRWKEFQIDLPQARVAIWIEGDLLAARSADEKILGSLVNSLHRLQSIHGILVYQVSGRPAFIRSIGMMLDKFLKDPHHLLPPTDSPPPDGGFVDLKKYKKTTVISPKCLWHNILTMVPGVSSAMANKIMESFPTLQSLMECRDVQQLSTIQLSTSRKLGKVIATRIMELMVTTTEEEISSVPEINNNVQHTETGVS